MANRNPWNSMREISTLHRGIDRLFDEFFDLAPSQRSQGEMAQLNFNPAVDVEEEEDHFLISVDLPGVKKEDVRIELNDNQLVISGERREEKKGEGKNRYFERSYGSFMRTFTLPRNVDADKIEADYQDGVLRIALPKAEIARGRTVEIGGQKGGLLTRMIGGKKESEKKEVKTGSKEVA